MIWNDLGYNQFFSKPKPTLPEFGEADFDLLVRAISADKITQGISQSTNLKIDYNQGQITRAEGAVNRLEIGKFLDGKYGMRVYDSSGNVTVDSTS